MRPNSSISLTIPLLAFAVGSCDKAPTAQQAQTPQWRLSDQPVLEIGVNDGRPEEMLAEVTAAIRLRNGRVLIIDQRAAQARLFDSTGRFLANIGRTGQGPGEYRWPFWVGEGGGDTLMVYDYSEGPGSMVQLLATGKPVNRAVIFPGGDVMAAIPLRLLPDGSVLLDGSINSTYQQGATAEGYRGEDGILRWRFGDSGRLIARVPGQVIREPGQVWSNNGLRAVSDSIIYAGTPYNKTILMLGLDGKARDSIVLPLENRNTSQADMDQYLAMVKRFQDANPGRGGPAPESPKPDFPETQPIFHRLLTDRAGNLWIALGNGMNSDALEFLVYSVDRKPVGTLTLPPKLIPLDIGSDYLLGRWSGEDDVQHVRLYRLMKS